MRYLRSAVTGQVDVEVAPTVSVEPCRKGSVLDDRIVRSNWWLCSWTSESRRVQLASK